MDTRRNKGRSKPVQLGMKLGDGEVKVALIPLQN